MINKEYLRTPDKYRSMFEIVNVDGTPMVKCKTGPCRPRMLDIQYGKVTDCDAHFSPRRNEAGDPYFCAMNQEKTVE